MTLKLTALQADNFMSILSAETSLKDRGLVLIAGENNDDDSFESNGAGKSTFFSEAIAWALYGQTIRGIKVDGVINRKVGKNTRVALTLWDDMTNDTYIIQRHRKHAQHGNHVLLFHNGENITGKSDSDTNAMIEEILGMDFLTFTNSIMFGQGLIKLFASATDAEQKKILEQMLQIDVFRSAQELAKGKVAELNSLIQDLQATVDKNKALHKSWDEKVQDLQAKEAELEDKVSKRILDLEADLASYREQLGDLESEESLIEEQETYKALLDKSLVKLDSYKSDEESRSEILSLIKSNDLEVSKLNKKISKSENELDGIRSGKNVPKKCEACGQSLPLDDTSHVENHLEQAIKDFRAEVADLDSDSKDLKSLLSKVDKKLEGKKQLELDIEDLKESVADINRDINGLEKNRNSIQDNIALTEKLIMEQKELMKTTYSDMIEKTISDIEQILGVISADEEVISVHSSKKDKYSFWVEAYGNQGIKSVLLDSVTPFLNERANNYLSKLSGSSIEVTFSTQQEVTSGKNKGQMKDKFAVEVNNQNGDLNYEGNSGGEKRRVDVAINMALQDLVFNRSNKRLDLIVYDEVFEGLDAVGCENVIHLLKEKAKQCGTVLVITHSDYLKQLFTKSMKMVKSGGQTIIKEDAV